MRKIVIVLLIMAICARAILSCEGSLHCVGEMKYKKFAIEHRKGQNIYEKIRQGVRDNVKKTFSSPEAELLLGMVLGVNDMYHLPSARKMFVDTGTIHVVVVSGFNISLVYNLISKLFRSSYKLRFLVLANIFVSIYVCLVGFQPPVVRAWIMGILGSISKYCGKKVSVLWLLILSGLLMLVYNPYYLFSLSFQLSFLATIGLIVFSEPLYQFFIRHSDKGSNIIQDDFISTVSAQVLVWPLLSYKFGTISLSSFFVNSLVLWTVPLVTILGFVYVGFSFVNISLASLLQLFLAIPLKFFIFCVRCFSDLRLGVLRYQVSLPFIIIYYIVAFFVLIRCAKVSDQKR